MGLLAPAPTPQARFANTPALDVSQAIRLLADRASRMDAAITPTLRNIAQAVGAQLAGLRHRLKSSGSLKEKLKQMVAHKHMTLEDAVPQVNDALRYSVVLPSQDFAAGCRRIQAALDEQGHARVKLVNHFVKRYEPFSAINVTLRDPEGICGRSSSTRRKPSTSRSTTTTCTSDRTICGCKASRPHGFKN